VFDAALFRTPLDQLFREPLDRSKHEYWAKFPDATGNVGQYSMGNEPSFHIPYLYNFTSPWKTQKRVRMLIDTWFTDTTLGMPGDEDGGANIEGLAIKGERLFFGFRGPAKNKEALVLSVDAAAFFQGTDAKPEVTRIVVGGGRGIRDLHVVKDGILVLAGPDDDEDNKNKSYRIALWNGKNGSRKAVKPKMLAQLGLKKIKLRDCDKETKPEALAVLEDSPERYRIMILSDGMCDGGAMSLRIPK